MFAGCSHCVQQLHDWHCVQQTRLCVNLLGILVAKDTVGLQMHLAQALRVLLRLKPGNAEFSKGGNPQKPVKP